MASEQTAPTEDVEVFLRKTHAAWSDGATSEVGRFLRRAARGTSTDRFVKDRAAELGRVLERIFSRHGPPGADEYLTGYDRMGMRWLLTNRRVYIGRVAGLDESDDSVNIPLDQIERYEVLGRKGWTRVTMIVRTRDGQTIELNDQLITPHRRLMRAPTS